MENHNKLKTFIRKRYILLVFFLVVFLTGLLIPENLIIPVEGAGKQDWNEASFWYYPWGKSGVHKGIDIFAASGKKVLAPTGGIVLYAGELARGGNVVVMLGPKWRIHYFAHLDEIQTGLFARPSAGEILGTVGTSGNAAGKPPHLHYSITTLIPYVGRHSGGPQGWKKMFYLNPEEQFVSL